MVDLVPETGLSDLVQALELVERNGVPVRHNDPVEDDGQPLLTEICNRLNLAEDAAALRNQQKLTVDRKSTRLNSSHVAISYAVFCLKKKNHVHVWSLWYEEYCDYR